MVVICVIVQFMSVSNFSHSLAQIGKLTELNWYDYIELYVFFDGMKIKRMADRFEHRLSTAKLNLNCSCSILIHVYKCYIHIFINVHTLLNKFPHFSLHSQCQTAPTHLILYNHCLSTFFRILHCSVKQASQVFL